MSVDSAALVPAGPWTVVLPRVVAAAHEPEMVQAAEDSRPVEPEALWEERTEPGLHTPPEQ